MSFQPYLNEFERKLMARAAQHFDTGGSPPLDPLVRELMADVCRKMSAQAPPKRKKNGVRETTARADDPDWAKEAKALGWYQPRPDVRQTLQVYKFFKAHPDDVYRAEHIGKHMGIKDQRTLHGLLVRLQARKLIKKVDLGTYAYNAERGST